MEAVSLTCDDDDDDYDTTDVCPGTELTCNCSVSTAGVIWKLPGSETIALDNKVGSKGNISGIFVAVVTKNTGGVLESMLTYTATESLVNPTIKCEEIRSVSASATITYIFAG